MTATYTFDVFSSLDGYGSYGPGGDWGGYWGKQGPELLDHRLASFDDGAADGLRRHHVPGSSCRCWPRAPRTPRCVTRGSRG